MVTGYHGCLDELQLCIHQNADTYGIRLYSSYPTQQKLKGEKQILRLYNYHNGLAIAVSEGSGEMHDKSDYQTVVTALSI
jgi:hypothetical protein